jgi:hypothetical protein
MLAFLRSLANVILGEAGKSDRLDTAIRMAMEADFSDRRRPRSGVRAAECRPD